MKWHNMIQHGIVQNPEFSPSLLKHTCLEVCSGAFQSEGCFLAKLCRS